jgi:hypothetical protein
MAQKPECFQEMTGKTQGIKLRMMPPIKAASMAVSIAGLFA